MKDLRPAARSRFAIGLVGVVVAILAAPGVAVSQQSSQQSTQRSTGTVDPAPAFDLDSGNAPAEIVVPRVVPEILQTVSPGANDATLVLRITTLVTNGWFDAIAPYHPTAVGVYSDLGRLPASESATNRNQNIAIVYASYRVLNSVLPEQGGQWRAMVEAAGLDPDDESTDPTTPVGLGNAAGAAVVAAREHDGMNQLGDEGGRAYHRQPYADYTGYEPVNTPDELIDPTRWQPLVVSDRLGIYRAQRFVTPQMALTTPYSYGDPARFRVPPPRRSQLRGPTGRRAYARQADRVLGASANLSDHRKMAAELFDDKLRGLGFSALFAAQSQKLSLAELVQLDFVTNLASFDAAIAVWHAKRRFDAVRPVTAIGYLYGSRPVTAWGGPGQGTVDDLPADQWRSYLNTADHPEYPSASTALCFAHARAARSFLGSDSLGWSVPIPRGSSSVEPGATPAQDLTLHWDTWTDFARECGISRLWGGVHFRAAITHGSRLGQQVGVLASRFLQRQLRGRPSQH